jgi:N-methylhydantoinase B/oxoprolinase/acetone carboxylase alpha subunit
MVSQQTKVEDKLGVVQDHRTTIPGAAIAMTIGELQLKEVLDQIQVEVVEIGVVTMTIGELELKAILDQIQVGDVEREVAMMTIGELHLKEVLDQIQVENVETMMTMMTGEHREEAVKEIPRITENGILNPMTLVLDHLNNDVIEDPTIATVTIMIGGEIIEITVTTTTEVDLPECPSVKDFLINGKSDPSI